MTQISINYAIVLYQLGVSKEDIRYSKELFEAADALYESLASPVVTLHEKYVVIDRLFPESMRAFFKVLCRNQSVSLIDEIFQAYRDYADEQENVLRAKLFYVEKPQEKQVEGLTAYLSKRFHKNKVVFEHIHEPELLAGFVIEAGGIRIDESVAGKLTRMKQKLVKR